MKKFVPLLSGWMINLKYSQTFSGIWITVGKCIKSSTKNNVLTDTTIDCHSEFILDKSAACDYNGPQVAM